MDTQTIEELEAKNDELQELVIWMTGCGYDFCQHEYFCKQRDKLLKFKGYEDCAIEKPITYYLIVTLHPNRDSVLLRKFGIENSASDGQHLYDNIADAVTYMQKHGVDINEADLLKMDDCMTTGGRYLEFEIFKLNLNQQED